MKVSNIPNTNIIYLIENYEALLFDAYGVLLNEFGVLPGAINLIDKLNNTNKPYFILTNDASRSVPTSSNFYKSFGLEIPEEKIITAGSLIYPYFQENNLKGSKCRVIGTDDCFLYVADAGGIVGCNSNHKSEGEIVIDNCFSNGYIDKNAGGIIGSYALKYYSGGKISVLNCYSTGDIGGNHAGGITGHHTGSITDAVNKFIVRNCYSNGKILGKSAGGIFGSNKQIGIDATMSKAGPRVVRDIMGYIVKNSKGKKNFAQVATNRIAQLIERGVLKPASNSQKHP